MTPEDIDSLEAWWIDKSRVNFLAFRQFINAGNFKCNWFVEDLSRQLQRFYIDFRAGKRPILIISTPPQHGKSAAVVDFIAWILGKCSEIKEGIGSNLKIILTAFSVLLSTRANRFLQRILESEKYQKIFPKVELPAPRDRAHKRDSELIEFVQDSSSFRNTTIGGAVTGESLDLGVIDDPIKGRQKANSASHREFVWDHLTDDFFTRFSEHAALLITLTPWHIDDPAHRLAAKESEAKWIRFKAIAEEDEKNRKQGEALFPGHKSRTYLLKRKKTMRPENWSALYQQNAVIQGGNQFKLEHFKWWTTLPQIKYKFIVADTAQKKGVKNDFTDFQLWGHGIDDNIYLLDHVHKKMEAPELRRRAKKFWDRHNTPRIESTDPTLRKFYIEDKSSGTGLLQELKYKKVRLGDMQRSTDKEFRADDVIPFIEEGRVYLNKDVPDVDVITTEAVQFPNGIHDDSIDNLMNAVEVTYINKDNSNNLRAAMEA